MRGSDRLTGELFSYVDLDDRIPVDHPLRQIKQLVDDVLKSLDFEFSRLYSAFGRESIPPERLLRALLLQAFFSVRSERQLMEQINYNLLFRWVVGLGVDDAVWAPTVFSKNRDRLLDADVAAKFMSQLLAHREVRGLLSDDHFSVDGTLIEAWASMKSFQPRPSLNDDGPKDGGGPPNTGATDHAPAPPPEPAAEPPAQKPQETPDTQEPAPMTSANDPKDGNAEVDFHGQKRSNATHVSTTDPEARLYRKGKGKEAKLCFMGHALMENRNGLIVGAETTLADGHAEREAALDLVHRCCPGDRQITLGADKGYDTSDFVEDLRAINVTPHIAAKVKGSALDGRTTRRAGYLVSQRTRKRIEEAFGWAKTIGTSAKTMLRGIERVGFQFTLTMAAYNLACLPRLLAD